jgi:hypothetical protein
VHTGGGAVPIGGAVSTALAIRKYRDDGAGRTSGSGPKFKKSSQIIVTKIPIAKATAHELLHDQRAGRAKWRFKLCFLLPNAAWQHLETMQGRCVKFHAATGTIPLRIVAITAENARLWQSAESTGDLFLKMNGHFAMQNPRVWRHVEIRLVNAGSRM